ncbi:MAG: class I SAM-dependent methyltransferase [Actinomycetota bacterium]|nr:class I SAM-dependent methyltransferase [Actinomycetota bacterium]
MYDTLRSLCTRPAPFEGSTSIEMWTDPHISRRMLHFHLDDEVPLASRPSPFAERSARWIAERVDLGPRSAVADLGCGPGHYTNRLARTGASVVGVDVSARSLDHARAEAKRAGVDVTYIHADYVTADHRDWEPGRRFDLVTVIMCDLCALGPRARRTLLAKIHGSLAPGGALLFDVVTDAAFAGRGEQTVLAADLMDGFWADEPYVGFHTTHRYEDELVTLDRFAVVTAGGVREYRNWMQHYDEPRLRDELSAAGFAVEALYGDLAGAPPRPGAAELTVLARPISR